MRTPEQISFNMSRVRSSGSKIELMLGRALWAAGIRYRKQYRGVTGKPDFAIVGVKIAVFCDSSFWHGRGWPAAASAFRTNREFWLPKIERNIARDRAVNIELRARGWLVLRFWDTQIASSTDRCVARVLRAIAKRKKDEK